MKTSRYNGGYIRPTRHGSFIAEVNYAYKRHKKTCKNVDDARAWIDGVQIELAKRTRPLDPWDLRDARIARDILPEGVTLADAARFYQAHHRGDPGLTIETVIQRHLDEKHKRRLREKTLTILTQRLRLLQTALGARPVAAVTPDELRAWLDARGLYGRTRNHYRAMLHDLFRFAVLSGYRETNPVAAIATVHIDDTQPGILTVDQTKALLRAAETRDPDCIPYLA
ncbi:MAG TPA: site-specific integrase, partial [Candidatus Hydrogenedentes bacterium]|nr:site-specific integrase [Candidatus Hydrogenedentota bacterium]